MLNSTTRNPVELLGPCFKTGRIAAPSLQHNILRIIHIGYLRNSLLASKKKMQRRSVRLYFAEFLQILITSTQRERVRVCYFLLLKFATMILCKAISLSLSLPLEQLNVVEGLTSWHRLPHYEGCFSSFPYGTCLLSVSIARKNKHQYLAFDVSLPPPNYLSCSPKQLDSGSTFTNYVKKCKQRNCYLYFNSGVVYIYLYIHIHIYTYIHR